MSNVIVFREGGYRYIKAVFQYSSGVAAEPGFEIERLRLLAPLGRPSTAFAACELRSAKPFTGGSFRERIVRYGDTSPEAMREKIRHVVAEMEARLAALGFSWQDAVSTQAYSVQDFGAWVGPEIAARGAAPGGLAWHFARPPVEGLEFEMDVRGAAREIAV